jgi:hypothetical protein
MLNWDTETDVKTNYSPECTIITSAGVFYGREGLLDSIAILDKQFSDADFLYTTKRWAGEIAFLEWQAEGNDFYIDDGAETFFIRNGFICAQTIHYTIRERER